MTSKKARLCVVTGASASGKDHLVGQLETQVQECAAEQHIQVGFHVIPSDMFYRDLSAEDRVAAHRGDFNFDDPSAINGDHLVTVVEKFLDLEATEVKLPVYNFTEHRQTGETTIFLNPQDTRRIVIVQGIFAMCFPKLREMCNLSVFLVTDPDVQVMRRISRDTVERGRNIEGVLKQYEKWVKPGYEKWVAPMKDLADLPMQYNETNPVVVEALALQLLYGKK